MEASDLVSYFPTGVFLLVPSYNIRYDNPEDQSDSWEYRKDEVLQFIANLNSNLFGLQEVLRNQLCDFKKHFKGYGYIGVGRDDGKRKGEYNPIFYNREISHVLDSGTFWLGPKPHKIGSRFEGARLNRICTWGKFKWTFDHTVFARDKIPSEVYLLNTHLDHESDDIKVKQIEVIINFIKSNIPEDAPLVLMGDFNSEADSECFKKLSESGIMAHSAQTAMIAKEAATFTGFQGQSSNLVIDHIWYRGFKNVLYAVLTDTRANKQFLSDHRPVIGIMQPI